MKNRLIMVVVLFTIALGIILDYRGPINYIVNNDGEIEWNSYSDEKLV